MALEQVHNEYWASEDSVSLIGSLADKVTSFDKHIDMTGRWLTARDVYYNYYLVNEQSYLWPSYGNDGFKRLNINHFRAILKHLLSLVTAQRVVPEPIATNSDYKSQAQVDFSKNILAYENRVKRLDKKFEMATETALLLGSAFVAREWDAMLGEVYAADPSTGLPQHKGDFVVTNYYWIDCIFDFAAGGWDETNWCILRKYYSRWDLIAKFPAYAEQIKGMSIAPEVKRHRLGHVLTEQNDDYIPLYTFYHKKTPAMPQGRATLFLDSNICLFDGGLPYKSIPVSRIVADEQINTPFAYSVSMDLLPIQKVYNALCSAICTNQAAFGVQNILIPREAAISLTQLTEGLNAIYYDPAVTNGAKPEALNLLMNKQEVFNWIEYLEKKMATISGVNDTIQGNPEANLKSGTALAFVASQALTFISPLSRSYNALLEETWTGIVDILKEFATTPRMVAIAGVSNRSYAAEFVGNDLADIDRVIIEDGNPLTQTLAGRIQVAQDLVQAGLLNKEEYLTVLQTGQLEPIYEYEKAELLSIRAAVEDLKNGKEVVALTTDNHPLRIREYLTVLASPDARRQPNNPIATNTLNAIMEHRNMWKTLTQNSPDILAIQNIPPYPMPPAPPPPVGPKISEMISFKDLPPEGQVQLAAKAGIDLTNGQQPPVPVTPGIPATPPSTGNPGHPGHNTGRENPKGSKRAGAPNLPGVMNNTPPSSPPTVNAPGMPKLPPGSPAPTQDAYAKLQAGVPQVPPMPH